MKSFKKSGIPWVFLVIMLAVSFMSCKEDEEQPDPSGRLPNVDFRIYPVDPKTGQEITGFDAPVSIAIDVPVGFDELNTWKKVEIDFGDGIVDVYDPYNLHNAFKSHVYYSAGKYDVTLRVSNETGTRELSKEVEILPFTVLKPFYLHGEWSIVKEKMSAGSASPVVNVWKKYHEKLIFGSYQVPFTYYRRSMHWLEMEEGALTFNKKDVTMTPQDLNEFFEVTMTVDSFYRQDGKVYASAHATIMDDDVGQILYEIVLEYVDYDDPKNNFDGSFFFNNRISVIEEETNVYAYSEQTGVYSELVKNSPKVTIPYNLMTIDWRTEYIIDNWSDGAYEELGGSYGSDIFVKLSILKTEEPVFILFDPEYENSNPDIYSIVSSTYYEDNDGRFRVETMNKIQVSNGTEATIGKDSLVGSWEIISKKETIDGNDVNPGNSETPVVGDVLSFNADGSADLGDGSESWFMLDDCNFVILPGNGEVLIHLNSYDENTGEMEIMSITHETEDNYKLTFGLLKQ